LLRLLDRFFVKLAVFIDARKMGFGVVLSVVDIIMLALF